MKDKVEMETHPIYEIRSCVKFACNWKEVTDTAAEKKLVIPETRGLMFNLIFSHTPL